jgi:hypothetical protein
MGPELSRRNRRKRSEGLFREIANFDTRSGRAIEAGTIGDATFDPHPRIFDPALSRRTIDFG